MFQQMGFGVAVALLFDAGSPAWCSFRRRCSCSARATRYLPAWLR
jgi:hypothetical protein